MSNERIVENMNVDWKFFRGDEPKAWYKGHDDNSWRNVTLPHDWSVEEPFSQQHSSGTGYVVGGIGWYRKHFTLPDTFSGKRVTITFDGVYNNAQVWCNSYYLGKRPYGYSTFTYDITDLVEVGDVDNVICVKVNHKDIADSRWFTGSGIYRDVHLTVTDAIHIDQYGVFVTTPHVSTERATVAARVQLCNKTVADEAIQVKNTLLDTEGNEVGTSVTDIAVDAESTARMEADIEVTNPHLWSPHSPYLYTLVTEIIKKEQILDRVQTVTGIRSIAFDAQNGFFLNGENMKIKGVCVHHDAGTLGAAVPQQVWVRRLKALKEMGCNAIRMSHNPPAANLLDLCDQMGFLVMDEAFDEWEGVKNKWWQGHNVYPPKHFGYYEDFPQWAETDIKEMVLRDRNHPSIILWSIGNEVDYPNDPYCHPYFQTMTGNNDANKPAAEREYDPNKPNAKRLATIAKRLVTYVKECDTTRPVTAALAFPELSNQTGYADALDVVGYNDKEHLYEDDHRTYPDRVIYGSENGPHMDAWRAVRDNDYMCAQFIWTGIDYLGEAKGWPVRASPAGFIDLAGFKKPSYYFRQSLWSEEPMAFLTATSKDNSEQPRQPRWCGVPHWNWQTDEQLTLYCFTNCVEAELFMNGRSLGTKQLAESDGYLSWDVRFEAGSVKVIAIDEHGRQHTHELHTAAEAAKIAMSVDGAELDANGQDIAQIEISITDGNENLVYLADQRIKVHIDGPGELLGLENGNVQDVHPYHSNERDAYNGKLIAYVRSKTTPGEITVRAEGQGLLTAQTTIKVK